MRVDVYKNLNRGCWSIRAGGRVIDHTESCAVVNARFVVRPAAQAKVAAGAHRSVHAWVTGELLTAGAIDTAAAVAVTYRPRERACFFRRDTGAPVWSADAVVFTPAGAFALNPAKETLR